MTNAPDTTPARMSVIRPQDEPVFPIEGDAYARAGKVWTNPAGTKRVGAFESLKGAKFQFDQPQDESLYVCSGHAIFSLDDGTSFDLHAGDLVQILPGTTVKVEVIETVRLFFVLT